MEVTLLAAAGGLLGLGVWGLGIGGLGLGAWGLGFGVWGWGFGAWVWELGLRVHDLVRVQVQQGCIQSDRALRMETQITGLGLYTLDSSLRLFDRWGIEGSAFRAEGS